MALKRTSTSTTPTMTQTAIRKLVANSIAATLEEAANIAQRLMDHVLKHNSVQGINDHKRKFDDRRTFTNNNNYRNNNNNRNNDHYQQQNRRQETFRAYAAIPTKNSRSSDQELQEQGASHWKQPATSVSNLLCLWRERALQKSVPKSKQGCPSESIHAEGQRMLPKTRTYHFFLICAHGGQDDEEEEEEEEDPEMEEEIEEEDNDDDDAKVINPYEEANPLNLPPPDSDTESEDTAVAPTPDDHEQEDDAATVGTITRVPYSVRPLLGLLI
ncbi:hypothetical protein Tco_0270664 [Tanacetum coccineum]